MLLQPPDYLPPRDPTFTISVSSNASFFIGTLLGKIFLGETSANFNFAGDGGVVICAETNLYYAKIGTTSGGYTGDC
jgi:hypothetical protein